MLVDEIAQMIRIHSKKMGAGQLAEQIFKAVLSNPNIIEIDPDAELPKNPYTLSDEYEYHEGVECYKQLLKEGSWKKEKK